MELTILLFLLVPIGYWLCFELRRYNTTKKEKINIEKINNFEKYMLVLNYFMDKAYQIVYKDQILVYSLEAMRPNETQFETAIKSFVTLVLSLLGPQLKEELINLFGNEETLYFNITEYFNFQYEGDEIRKNSVDNLMNQETATE